MQKQKFEILLTMQADFLVRAFYGLKIALNDVSKRFLLSNNEIFKSKRQKTIQNLAHDIGMDDVDSMEIESVEGRKKTEQEEV